MCFVSSPTPDASQVGRGRHWRWKSSVSCKVVVSLRSREVYATQSVNLTFILKALFKLILDGVMYQMLENILLFLRAPPSFRIKNHLNYRRKTINLVVRSFRLIDLFPLAWWHVIFWYTQTEGATEILYSSWAYACLIRDKSFPAYVNMNSCKYF